MTAAGVPPAAVTPAPQRVRPLESTRPSLGRKRRGRGSDHVVGRSRRATAVFNAIGLLFTAIMAFPVYWMVNTAFKPSNEILTFQPNFLPLNPTLANFSSALHAPNFLNDLRNSLVITLTGVLISLVVGFLGALAIARFRFAGRRGFILTILLVQMVPLNALLIPMFLVLNGWRLTDTIPGVIVAYLLFMLPYTVWMLRGFIANVPRELDEAALVDGCSRWQTFWRIILPLTGPGLVASSIYGFILAWNEFLIINTLNNSGSKQNLQVWLTSFQTAHGTFWGPMMAGATLTSLPVVIFFMLIQRHVATGLTAGAVKG